MLFLKIIGILFLCLVLFFFFLSCLKAKVQIRSEQQKITAKAGLGPVMITLYPRKESTVRKQKEKKRAKKRKSGKEKKISWKRVNKKELLDFALVLLAQFKKAIAFDEISLSLILATDNAAKTGILYGNVCAVCGVLHAALHNNFQINRENVHIGCDFDHDKIKYTFDVILYTRPIVIAFIVLKNLTKIIRFYKKISKTEE